MYALFDLMCHALTYIPASPPPRPRDYRGCPQSVFLEQGAVQAVCDYLANTFSGLEKGSPEFSKAVDLPCVPSAINVLHGMARRHTPAALAVREAGVLPLLHSLEGVSSVVNTGTHAENLLEELIQEGQEGDAEGVATEACARSMGGLSKEFAASRCAAPAGGGEGPRGGLIAEIRELRAATKGALKRRAMERREQMLREMGMKRIASPGGCTCD